MLTFRRTAILLFVLAWFVAPAFARKQETGFLDRVVTINAVAYKYQVFVPDNWSPKQKWPVILFLHGAGERSDDGMVQTEVGIGTAIRRNRERFPTIVVMPQCRKGIWWNDPLMADVAMAALAAATNEFHGDSSRTYLTGLSMGGYGTWYLAGKYAGKFAAIVPICGGILEPDASRSHSPDDLADYAEASKKIGSKTPVWIFHGGADPVVPVEESRRMNDAMKAQGGEVHYTEYPGVGHDSWVKAYAEPELMTWLLSKTLTGSVVKK